MNKKDLLIFSNDNVLDNLEDFKIYMMTVQDGSIMFKLRIIKCI